jgi:hypothetical protein
MQETKLTIKIVIFRIKDNNLTILLKHNRLPGQTVIPDKPLDEAARQIFLDRLQTPLKNNYLEQLYTVKGKPGEIALVYYVLFSGVTKNLPEEFFWTNTNSINRNIEDFSIIQYAIQRLQWKIEYTNIIYSLLPQTFTLTQLQTAYEIILIKTLDKRNFRKKILSLDFLEMTNQKYTGSARPAQMYRFKERKPVIVKVFS